MADAYYALVPAAGSGSRFGPELPKQYCPIRGRPMLEHAVRALARLDVIDCVFVALSPRDRHFASCDWRGVEAEIVPLYCGGPTRAGSVFNALMAIRGEADDAAWVLVHDAARPCVSAGELQRLVHALSDDQTGGLLALPVADTLKRADESNRVCATEPRAGLWRALTPQMFRYRLLVEALHRSAGDAPTDESAAIERLGLKPRLVPGTASNIKVTYAEDIALAEAILGQAET
ncbi:MAG: 2-C-methyl-D-erythritol 4-phosphate cytidylyltransferase [Burkholderiales bacterium]|nr:2-C-methyl-D-erythritol 4-phosphate cytidylyltransferase [Burkholderiales bacterium]